MASTATDDFENDWTFVDRDGKVDIEPRKNSVSYSKPPVIKDEDSVSLSEDSAKDDSEGEAEFEVLSGFQCHQPPESDEENGQEVQGMAMENDSSHGSYPELECEADDELVPIQENSCECAADDGIMIISNHFCLNKDAETAGDVTVDDMVASECDQENLLPSDITSSTTDGWRELPQLSESGSFSFHRDPNNSEDDNEIEPIPEEEASQDYVELSHNSPVEMVESRSSVLSFDSDLFNEGDLDEEINEEGEHPDITEASAGENNSDQDAEEDVETEDHLTTVDSSDGSSIHVDAPTLFLLLGVTTALGFSIGYGLSVYISSQALEVSGNVKRPGLNTASLPLGSDPMESLDEVSHDFLDQLTAWKLEDHLDPQRNQEPDNELGDLFDTKVLHEKLQQKHFKLMGLHESVKQRLRMSKVMSWYWRLKYEEERSKGGGSNWSKVLQEQLQHMEQLYLQEKHTANLWRRMNENRKLRRAVASGVKFDKYWKDFLTRWRKDEGGSPGVNESQKLTDSTDVDKKPKRANSRGNLKTEAQKLMSMRDSSWREFRTRWTKDSQLKGRLAEASSESGKCVSGDIGESKDMSLSSGGRSVTTETRQTSLSSWLSPTFVESQERKDSKAIKSARHSTNNYEEASEFKKDPSLAGHHTFSQNSAYSWVPRDKLPPFLKSDDRKNTEISAPVVTSKTKQPFLKMYWLPKGSSKLKLVDWDIVNAGKLKGDRTPGQKVGDQRIRSYQDYFHVRKWKKVLMEQNSGLPKPILPEKQERSASVATSEPKKTPHSVYWLPEGLTKSIPGNWDVMGELKAIISGASLKTGKTSDQEVRDQRIKPYRDYFAQRKHKEEEVEQTYGPAKQNVLENQGQGVDNMVEAKQQLLKKQKKMLRNLTVRREEEIRKHRLQRRKLKKKEKEAKQHFEEAELLLSELKQERHAMDMEKRKLRRSWRALKREKKKFSYEREVHKTDKKALKRFTVVLKEEKRKLKRLKGKFKKKVKELFAKEKKVSKMKKKMEFETKKEVERLRGEIAQEKEKLQKQQRTLKSLKKAARKELKKWLGEVRKIKRKEKERRKAKKEKKQKQARKKWEQAKQERRRKTEYDAVVQEQAKYEKEKRRKKGEYGDTEKENTKERERRKSDKNEEQEKGSQGKAKDFDREFSFRQQLEDAKQWLSNVHKKTLERQQTYWSSLFARTKFDAKGEGEKYGAKPGENHKQKLENFKQWLSSLHKKTIEKQKSYWGSLLGETIFNVYGRQSERPEGKEDNQQEQSEKIKRDSDEGKEDEKVAEDGEKSKQTEWENSKDSSTELVSGMEKRGRDQKSKEKKELSVRKSELTTTSGDRALTGFVNLTFEVDLVKTLLKGLEKRKGKSKTANGEIEAADSRAFVILSEGPTLSDGSDFKGKTLPKKPKIPEERQWQVPIKAKEPREWHQPSDPIPPEGFRLTPEEWYEKQFEKRNKGKKVVPQGPILSEDEHRVRLGEESMRKQDITDSKVCTFHDSGKGEPIPPPDWVFRRARKRAKDRADQRSLPWYEQRAHDRFTQRSEDEHVTQFPCGLNWKQRFSPWYDRRAQDRSFQRSRDQHATQFPCGPNWKRRTDQRSNPWYDRRAQDRGFQRRTDKHTTQFPHGQKRKRSHNHDFERANDQRSNHVPWYSRRAEDWESHHRESMDPWSSEYGHFRDHLHDWMPQGPSMDEPH